MKAGYSEKTAYRKGHQLRWQFQREIEDETRRLMQAAVPGALAQVVDLAARAMSEQVRLQVANASAAERVARARERQLQRSGVPEHAGITRWA